MTPVLEQATKARQKSIQLKSIEFAQELSKQLLTHAISMGHLDAQLSGAVTAKKPNPESFFEALFEEIDAKFPLVLYCRGTGFLNNRSLCCQSFQQIALSN